MLTITATPTNETFLDETAQYMINTYGYEASHFAAEKLSVVVTGPAHEIEALVAECDLLMLPCPDENGCFVTSQELLDAVKAVAAAL